jgi:hypothetical protein
MLAALLSGADVSPRLVHPVTGVRVRNACEMVPGMHDRARAMPYNSNGYWGAWLNPDLARLLKNDLAQPDAVPGA